MHHTALCLPVPGLGVMWLIDRSGFSPQIPCVCVQGGGTEFTAGRLSFFRCTKDLH